MHYNSTMRMANCSTQLAQVFNMIAPHVFVSEKQEFQAIPFLKELMYEKEFALAVVSGFHNYLIRFKSHISRFRGWYATRKKGASLEETFHYNE